MKGHFLLFDTPNNPKNQNFEKMKKTKHLDIILHSLVYHKWWSYDVWFLRYGVRQSECFDILEYFLPFYLLPPNPPPPNNLENQNEKMPGYIIILLMCTINENHMMYGSWDMECNIFCPFNPTKNQKFKILKNWKKKTKTKKPFIVLH